MPLSKDFNFTEFLGIDPEKYKDDDEFKAAFPKEWLKAETAHLDKGIQGKIVGKEYGSMRTKFKKYAKDHGLSIEAKEIDEMDPAELVDTISEATKGHYGKTIEDLTAKVNAKGTGKEDWDAEKLKYDKKIEALTGDATSWKGKHDQLKADQEATALKMWEDMQWEDAYGDVDWIQSANKYTIEGHRTEKRKQYKVARDEVGKPIVTDLNGTPIMNPNRAATAMTLKEIIHGDVRKEKLWKENPHGNAPVKVTVPAGGQPPSPNGAGQPRRMPLNPLAVPPGN